MRNFIKRKKSCGLKSYYMIFRESTDIIVILHFYENSTSCWYKGGSQPKFETFLAYKIVQMAEITEKNGFSFQDFCRRYTYSVFFYDIIKVKYLLFSYVVRYYILHNIVCTLYIHNSIFEYDFVASILLMKGYEKGGFPTKSYLIKRFSYEKNIYF